MVNIDPQKGIILRCDGCGGQITDLREANAVFTAGVMGEQMVGVYCIQNCVRYALQDPGAACWQLHHLVAMLADTVQAHQREARCQLDMLGRLEL